MCDVCISDTDFGEAALHFHRPGGRRGKLPPSGEQLLDMSPAFEKRVHHRERILKHERDSVSAKVPHLSLWQGEEVAAVEVDFTCRR